MYVPGRRELLFAALYFCEGAPIGFLWWALPAYWAAGNLPVAEITLLTAAAAVPWSFKWLWAPLVDLTAPRVGYRRWIIVAQVIMGLSLLPLVWLDPHRQFYLAAGRAVDACRSPRRPRTWPSTACASPRSKSTSAAK